MTLEKILIEINREPLFKSYAAKMSPKFVNEIISEVIIIIAEMDREKVLSLYSKGDLKRYIITVITNMVINPKSPFNKMYNSQNKDISKVYNYSANKDEEDVFISSEALELIQDIKAFILKRSLISEEEAINSDLFYRFTFGGETFQEISDSTGIAKTSVFNTVKSIEQIIETKFKTQYGRIRNI